jgi:hypothetical protein
MKVCLKKNEEKDYFLKKSIYYSGEYTCQIDDDRGIKTSGYLYVEEPQWRFETKLPGTLEGDEGDKIELECSVQDEDAECDWYFAGEVSHILIIFLILIMKIFNRKFFRN